MSVRGSRAAASDLKENIDGWERQPPNLAEEPT
jgi:hypothetical protein